MNSYYWLKLSLRDAIPSIYSCRTTSEGGTLSDCLKEIEPFPGRNRIVYFNLRLTVK
jgi:hypothetical protein